MSVLHDQLSAIRARADAATEGPWHTSREPGDAMPWCVRTDSGGHGYLDVCRCPPYATHDEPNSAFIAAARTHVPRLVRAVEVMDEAIAAYVEAWNSGASVDTMDELLIAMSEARQRVARILAGEDE